MDNSIAHQRYARGCQFGNHGEPFLWHGSGNEGTDIAIMELLRLSELSPKLAHEASEFIHACLQDAGG